MLSPVRDIRYEPFLPYAPLSDYNVFHILGISAKDVIMCRFLADLLNPEGQHGKSKFMPENRRGNAATIINMRKILVLSI